VLKWGLHFDTIKKSLCILQRVFGFITVGGSVHPEVRKGRVKPE
jgi:hypothetical protein